MSNDFPTFSPIFQEGTLYLCFLHFESFDLPQAVTFVRDACERSKNVSGEIKSLFADAGWREHLVAGAALLVQKSLNREMADNLWCAFDKGSWVSPQLAVIAFLRVPEFARNAKRRIRDECPQDTTVIDQLPPLERHVIAGPPINSERSAKGLSALVYLVGLSENEQAWLAQELLRDEIKQILEHDLDCGGIITEKWLMRLKLKSKSLGITME